MVKEFVHSLRMLTVMTITLGIIYPVVMTGFAQTFFADKANGSLLYQEGNPVGSKFIGQGFADEKYFHGRPSCAGGNGYDAASSSGSNLGPTSKDLITSVAERAKAVREINGLALNTYIPSDLVTASGSGLDPHITPSAAAIQMERVAKARNMSIDEVQLLVEKNTENPTFGFMGDTRVNVVMLNLDLDKVK